MLTKFYVKFEDPNYNPDIEPETEPNTYKNSIPIHCTDEQFYAVCEQNAQLIDHIETTYGILDIEGDNHSIGYNSYEIELKDADYVFKQLCNIFKSLMAQ